MKNFSTQYFNAQITKFIFVFFLIFIPVNVNSEVNLTEILNGKTEQVTNEIRILNEEMNVLNRNKDLILSHESERLRVKLLDIGQKLKSLKQDLSMQVNKNNETSEIYDYAIDVLNNLVCKKYLLGEFSDTHLSEFNMKC